MKISIISLILILPCFLFAQLEVTGKIIDKDTGLELIGATVAHSGGGTTTDESGNFSLALLEPSELTISYIGYNDHQIRISKSESLLSISLVPSDNILEVATVTSSRYEQRISESAISIDILSTRLIENSNATTISDALIKVPGVQMLDGQANIRGGSGFSYGAGSRVMLLLNDMPILQPDAGFPSWNDIPVENISQVEVVKGSSSSMYGSSALNGIINIRTKYATSEPETSIAVGGRMYQDFDREEISSSTDTPLEYFLSAVHRSRLTEKLDIVLHGYFFDQESFADSTYQNRARIGLTTRYRLTDRLTLNLNSMYNVADNSSFFIWNDGEIGNLVPFPNTISSTKNKRFIIDPSIIYFDPSDNKHVLRARYYNLNNDNSLNQSNASSNLYTEYQFQKNIEKWDVNLTAGLVNQYLKTDSELFSNVEFTSTNLGGYLELDKKFFNALKLSLGGRYEYNKLNVPQGFEIGGVPVTRNLKDGSMIYKGGLNYQLSEYTFLRAAYGQGYRFPTIVERFITTTFGSFAIKSNPILKPESGWTAELGLKQGFNLLGFKGFLDLAVFRQDYSDMMEFVFLLSEFAFQSQNIGNTIIDGYEIGIMGQIMAGKHPISVFGGYTYMDPRYKNFENNTQLTNTLSEEEQNVLKYRSKHLFKLDIEAKVNKFSFAVASNSASHMINIDQVFEGVGGIGAYRDLNNQGYFVTDLRCGYTLDKMSLTLLFNNVFNKEYTVRPAELEAPRNLGFRLQYEF